VSAWRVADRDGRIALFTEDALREAVARGHVASDCLVWREGLADWEPIESHFPRRAANRRADGVAARTFRALGLLLASMLFIVAALVSLTTLGSSALDHVPSIWVEALWIGEAVGLGGAALLLLTAWWRASRHWASAEGRGLVRILVVVLALAGAGVASLQAWQAGAVGQVAMVTETMRDYVFTYDPEARTLRIQGQIGPGFAIALDQRLRAHPVQRVEITSPGGLTDEALNAARRLETAGVSVTARGFCASACIIVLMGGERRLADYDMTLDFHASSASVDLDTEFSRYIQREAAQEARAYLLKRGAPEAYVREADRLGPSKIYRVPAVILVEPGVLTGLVDGTGAPITLVDARERLRVQVPDVTPTPHALSLDALDLNQEGPAS